MVGVGCCYCCCCCCCRCSRKALLLLKRRSCILLLLLMVQGMVVIGRFCCNCSYNICCCFCWYREMLQLEGFAVAVVVAVTGSDVITVVTMMTFALSTFYLSTSLYLLLFLHTFIKKIYFHFFSPSRSSSPPSLPCRQIHKIKITFPSHRSLSSSFAQSIRRFIVSTV